MKNTLLLLLALTYPAGIFAQNAPSANNQTSKSISTDKAAKIEALMRQYNTYEQFDGTWLVAENDKAIYKGAVGYADRTWNIPNQVDTKFGIASNVKQFVAVLILQLAEQGKVRLEGKITDYLPEYPKATGSRITVHQLLTHTSGIPNYTNFKDQWSLHYYNFYSQAEYVKRFSEKKLDFEPGTKFKYNNSGYYLLGMIIERLSGKSFEDALHDNILKPLGMTRSGCMREEVIADLATSYHTENLTYRPFKFDYTGDIATGDMYSTVDDIYKWQKALFSDQLLSATSRQLMSAPYVLDTSSRFKKLYFGYGLMTKKLPTGLPGDSVNTVFHTGGLGYTSLIMRLPDAGHSIILLNNIFNMFGRGETINFAEISQAIINILYDKPYNLPTPELPLALRKEIKIKGLQPAIKQFTELKKTSKKLKDEWELNQLGYYYLARRQFPEAIGVFKLNIVEFLHPRQFS